MATRIQKHMRKPMVATIRLSEGEFVETLYDESYAPKGMYIAEFEDGHTEILGKEELRNDFIEMPEKPEDRIEMTESLNDLSYDGECCFIRRDSGLDIWWVSSFPFTLKEARSVIPEALE